MSFYPGITVLQHNFLLNVFQLNGYENVDGLDHDLAVLDASRQEALYRNYIVGRVAELGSIPVKDGWFLPAL